MSGVRAGLGLPGADAATIVGAAQLAEQWNVDCLWMGDPCSVAGNADDTYVMVAAAAAAATTEDLRVGVFLSARSSAPPLRVAEDIGVVDQLSGGRLAIAFTAPESDDTGWSSDIARIAAAPTAWSLPDGRVMPVTPAPAQPAVPITVIEGRPGASLTGRFCLGPGPGLLVADWSDAPRVPSLDDLLAWKARAAAADAGEVILLVAPDAPLVETVAAFGTVVAPCLRAADHETEILALDATRWLERCADLHRPPD